MPAFPAYPQERVQRESRRARWPIGGKPTVAHVKFVKAGRVFAHYQPPVGHLLFGRKAKIADEGQTVEEATARVLAYDDYNLAARDEFG